MSTPEIARGTVIALEDILIEDRFRKEMGDVHSMAASIKEFGMIQPAVIVHDVNDSSKYRLVAGGRRMAAVKLLKWKFLEIGKHVIIRGETYGDTKQQLRLQSMELEENLKRKDMTWPEQVEAKQRLMELMVKIHGETGAGAPTKAEKAAGDTSGFGVRKLAAMLGEAPSTVSQDLQLAKMARSLPQIKTNSSKQVAMQQATGMLVQAAIQKGMVSKETVAANTKKLDNIVAKPLDYRVLVFCSGEQQQGELMIELTKRGLKCQAIIT